MCLECQAEYEDEENGPHSDHQTELLMGDTFFSLGWGHLEARLQTCLIQVDFPHFSGLVNVTSYHFSHLGKCC